MFLRWVWDYLAGGMFPIKGDGLVTVQWQQGVYRISAKIPPAAKGGGDSWPPIELDPSKSCVVGDWRYVAPTDAIATTGLKDLTLGIVIQAAPGLWRARLAVPAATVAGYNVPQDLGIRGYWVLIQGYGYC